MKKLNLLIGAIGFAFSSLASAQAYPSKPVKIIVSFPPGSVIDTTARTIGQKLTDLWGQPVTVDNRPGGGGTGTVGAEALAKSPADGYTWMLQPNSVMVIGPQMVKTPFDVFRDFAPVGQVAITPFLLAVATTVPANTVAELVAYGKANPSKLNYGSSGNGSPQHLGGELLKRNAGIEMVHVPYKGANQAITDLLGGRLQVFIGAAGSLFPHIKDGKIKMLASAGSRRLGAYLNVPTIAETLPGTEVDAWLGVYMPTGAPREAIAKAGSDITAVLNVGETRNTLSAQGIEVVTTSPDALTRLMRDDYARWGKLIREAGIKAD